MENPRPSDLEVQELRSAAVNKLKEIGTEHFDTDDVARITHDLSYVKRFLIESEYNQQAALNHIISALQWRKTNRVAYMTVKKVKTELLTCGLMTAYNRDINGCKILIVNLCKFDRFKFPVDELKKFTIYWIERLERAEYGRRISIFFNVQGSTVFNISIDMIVFILNLRDYYPDILNNVIIFELPWALSFLWTYTIKPMLPSSIAAKVRLVDCHSIHEVIASDQLHVDWGGEIQHDFSIFTDETAMEQQLPWPTQKN